MSLTCWWTTSIRCTPHGLRVLKSLKDKDNGLKAFVFADPDRNRIDVGQRI